MPVDPSRAPLAGGRAAHGTALLIIDMISTWDFPDANRLAVAAVRIAPCIGALLRRCTRENIPVIYVNDNQGRWRSEFSELASRSVQTSPAAARIAQSIAPTAEDYAVLKPKHSAFFATPLDLLLRHLHATRLLITGVAADLCIVMSAAEARMRDYDVIVPRDCVAALSAARTAQALHAIEAVHQIRTTPSRRIRFARA